MGSLRINWFSGNRSQFPN